MESHSARAEDLLGKRSPSRVSATGQPSGSLNKTCSLLEEFPWNKSQIAELCITLSSDLNAFWTPAWNLIFWSKFREIPSCAASVITSLSLRHSKNKNSASRGHQSPLVCQGSLSASSGNTKRHPAHLGEAWESIKTDGELRFSNPWPDCFHKMRCQRISKDKCTLYVHSEYHADVIQEVFFLFLGCFHECTASTLFRISCTLSSFVFAQFYSYTGLNPCTAAPLSFFLIF